MRNPGVALTLFAFSVFATCAAQAQATRTWVSGVGDDANPCSRTAPCKTFAGAISKTQAGGEIDALDPGGFGAVTITKAITIDGGGGQVASVLVAGTNGITVVAGPSDVVALRNLHFQGIASGLVGIQFSSGAGLFIQHCVIETFTQNGIKISPSAAAQVFIDDTVSRSNAGSGLFIVGSSGGNVQVNVSNSHFSNNGGYGLFSQSYAITAVINSDATGNTTAGFVAESSGGVSTLSIANSMAANNGIGVAAGGGTSAASVQVSNVSLFGNTTGFFTGTNGTISSFGNNANGGTGTPGAHIALQ